MSSLILVRIAVFTSVFSGNLIAMRALWRDGPEQQVAQEGKEVA